MHHLCPRSRRHPSLSRGFAACQALVRFFALHRIKPHAPPLVRAPVNSFEFHSCERTPQAGYLTLSAQQSAFAVGVLSDLYTFHRSTGNSLCPYRTPAWSERGHFPPVLSSFFCWIAAPALTPMDQTESDDSLYHLLQGPFLFYFLNSVRKDFTVDSAESPTSVYLYEQSIHPDLDPYPDHPVSSFGSPRIINPGSRNTHSIMEMTYI
ncbi:hypothetical protein GQ457_08G030900 [Hibiscus cannabinus]